MMKDQIVFDINQVIDVFTQRAEGKTLGDIAEAMGCSTGYVSKVLSREKHGDLKLDEELVKRAGAVVIKRKPAVKKKGKPQLSASKALVAYGDAIAKSAEARDACVEAGVSDDALGAFTDAILSVEEG